MAKVKSRLENALEGNEREYCSVGYSGPQSRKYGSPRAVIIQFPQFPLPGHMKRKKKRTCIYQLHGLGRERRRADLQGRSRPIADYQQRGGIASYSNYAGASRTSTSLLPRAEKRRKKERKKESRSFNRQEGELGLAGAWRGATNLFGHLRLVVTDSGLGKDPFARQAQTFHANVLRASRVCGETHAGARIQSHVKGATGTGNRDVDEERSECYHHVDCRVEEEKMKDGKETGPDFRRTLKGNMRTKVGRGEGKEGESKHLGHEKNEDQGSGRGMVIADGNFRERGRGGVGKIGGGRLDLRVGDEATEWNFVLGLGDGDDKADGEECDGGVPKEVT
ncbi:hypothetical protein BC827DRAFT_1151762 [Russula dissimulans]|nr:hypothetical protein BC827DRAFT_1151762 [Russula dissimulans]